MEELSSHASYGNNFHVPNQDLPICLVPATSDHDRLLWHWANDPQVRAMSFSTDPIPWEKHVQWLANKLMSPDCWLWIALHKKQPIGYIRFDRTAPGEAEISIGLAPEARGKGYSKFVIQSACHQLFEQTETHTIHAYIKPANLASIRAFETANFVRVGFQVIQGSEAFHYKYQKS